MPSEAEWEYSCRGGSESAYSFGDDALDLGKYAWCHENAWDIGEKYAHEVGQKRGNGFGLHDMHGNVWEWCGDYYGKDYYNNSPKRDPTGPDEGTDRVSRGGSGDCSSRGCRSASRSRLSPDYRLSSLGFRVLRSSTKASRPKQDDARQRQGAESPISRSSADSPGELSSSQVLSRLNAYLIRTKPHNANLKSLLPEYGRIINGLKRSEKMQVGGATLAFPSKQVWKTRPDIRESIIHVLTENGVL